MDFAALAAEVAGRMKQHPGSQLFAFNRTGPGAGQVSLIVPPRWIMIAWWDVGTHEQALALIRAAESLAAKEAAQ